MARVSELGGHASGNATRSPIGTAARRDAPRGRRYTHRRNSTARTRLRAERASRSDDPPALPACGSSPCRSPPSPPVASSASSQATPISPPPAEGRPSPRPTEQAGSARNAPSRDPPIVGNPCLTPDRPRLSPSQRRPRRCPADEAAPRRRPSTRRGRTTRYASGRAPRARARPRAACRSQAPAGWAPPTGLAATIRRRPQRLLRAALRPAHALVRGPIADVAQRYANECWQSGCAFPPQPQPLRREPHALLAPAGSSHDAS